MAVHASHAALPFPVKGARYSLLVPLLDADGDPTAQTTPDTEISEDNGAATDAAEEVSATSGMDGMGLITFTGAETDCSCLAVNFKAASGPKATLATLYPRVLPVAFTGTASAGAAGTITLAGCPAITDLLIGCIVKTTGGTGGGGTGGADNQARMITAYTSGRVATVVPNWETTPDNTTTFEVLITEHSILRYADVKAWLGTAAATPSVAGVPEVDLTHSLGVAVTNSDFTIASATATTVVLPATYTNGNSLPDDDRYIWTALQVVGGTGAGQLVLLTTAAAGAREYNVVAASMPVQLDNTSTCVVSGSWSANATHLAGQTITAAAGVTFPASVASPTNITAGTLTTVTNLTNLPAITANWLTAAGIAADAGAEFADAVWDEAIAGHLGAGSTGEALNAAGAAGDPWVTALPGAYGAGSAGKIIGDNLNATVSSRATPAQVATELGTYDGPTNAEMVAAFTEIKGATWATTDTLEAIRDRGDAAWITATGFATSAALASLVTTVGAAGAGLTEAGGDGDHLTAINLPNQTMDIVGNITGNLSGSMGSVTGLTAANLDAAISTRATPAQVNAEVLDVLTVDTFAQPGQEAPAATTTLGKMLAYCYKLLRNKLTQSSTELKVYADDGTTVDQKATVSDDGTTYTRGEIGTGP